MTIQQAFEIALGHHQAGRLAEAEALYRQILAVEPRHTDALHLLGVIAHQVGRNEVAVDLIRQAIALAPGVPEYHSNLGNALRNQGQLDEAIAAFRQAIALNPAYAEAHNNLGNALRDSGQLDEAIAACRQAITFKPYYAEAHSNLGNVLRDKGQLDEAIAACRQAIALKPNFPEAHNNLGNALRDKGQPNEAIAAYRQAVALKPDHAEAHSNLGNALLDKGQLDEAIAAVRQAIVFNPHLPEAYSILGNALKDEGQLDKASAAYHQAIALRPNYAEVHNNLATALLDKGQPDEAVAACHRAIALRPNYAKAYGNLGSALKDKGELDQAIAAYRQAIALQPHFPEVHGNLVFALHYQSGDPRVIAEEQQRWNRQYAEPLRQCIPPHRNDRSPERRLRIGYVSPDFREHCQSLFTIPVFGQHDHHHFEIFCYASVRRPDAVTARVQGYADTWRNTAGWTEEQIAAQVYEDQIDILVDLTLHMADNRLLVFARKPAPVQVTWLGYPGSTGLRTIDYRLSDPYLDPPGMDESIYSEQTFRLPHSFWCYGPLDCVDIPVNALPAKANGFITFGCLNNFCKINDAVLRLWARVLGAVPSSRLLLLAPEGNHRQHTLDVLSHEGIAGERIEFVARQPRRKYLELYHRIDLGLDTLPYNGHSTSMDSFWMGVPVVTLVGQTIVGRAGLSQLMNLSLPELIAHSPEQYVEIATGLANELPRLSELRATLRTRMEQSPLMDAPRFARDIEAAYREMWRKSCMHNNPALP